MAIRIFIRRRVPADKEEKLLELIKGLRSLAVAQPGYISGETLRSVANPDEYLVISTWQSVEDWNTWESGRERREIQDRIDALLGEKTKYEAYYHPQRSGARLSGFKGWEGG
jgi:heme-degrading monooxygenase HmoA